MSRLLHAAARGARIQRREFNEREWWTAYDLDVNKGSAAPDCVYRIHPDDAALAYGPISTVLREEALDSTVVASVYGIEFGTFWLRQTDHAVFQNMSQLERSLFLLILAEALADEGL